MRGFILRLAAWGGALLALGTPAWADDIHVAVRVAEASNSGTQVAPELTHMARDFKRKGLAFSSYKLLAQQTLDIQRGASASVEVPGAQPITLTWTGGDVAKLLEFKVNVPGQPELNLRIHSGGSSFVEAGKSQSGSVILMELKNQRATPPPGPPGAPAVSGPR